MIKIPLSRGKIATIDDCDRHLFQYKWWFCENKKSSGYAVRKYQLPNYGKIFKISLHHAVMGQPINGMEIDHIDGDGLNNCRSNLRIVTKYENMANCKIHRSGKKSSRFVGVTWSKQAKRWQAQIQIKGKNRFLGHFVIEEDAAEARRIFFHKITNVMTY